MPNDEGAGDGQRNLLQVIFGTILRAFSSLIAVTRAWVGRRSARKSVKLTVGGDALKVSAVKPEDQERLISEFLRRQTGAGGKVTEVESRISGGTLHGPVMQGRDFGNITFGQDQASLPIPPGTYDDLVRGAFAELVKPGRLLFNPPDRMRLGQTERVEVRLTRTLELDAELLEQLRGRGKPQLEEIPAAPRMAVTLDGDGFRIKAYSDEEQAVTQDGITIWEFDICGIKRGQQRLVIRVSLRIPVPGQSFECQSIPVRETTIDVQVGVPARVGHFVSSNWQWFIGTAIAVAAVVVTVLVH
jgi:hypothetical protein